MNAQVVRVHDISGILFSILLIIHLALHAKWFLHMPRMLFPKTGAKRSLARHSGKNSASEIEPKNRKVRF